MYLQSGKSSIVVQYLHVQSWGQRSPMLIPGCRSDKFYKISGQERCCPPEKHLRDLVKPAKLNQLALFARTFPVFCSIPSACP